MKVIKSLIMKLVGRKETSTHEQLLAEMDFEKELQWGIRYVESFYMEEPAMDGCVVAYCYDSQEDRPRKFKKSVADSDGIYAFSYGLVRDGRFPYAYLHCCEAKVVYFESNDEDETLASYMARNNINVDEVPNQFICLICTIQNPLVACKMAESLVNQYDGSKIGIGEWKSAIPEQLAEANEKWTQDSASPFWQGAKDATERSRQDGVK